ncbi:FAD-dependent oxidoreductase domain-containing protein 2-like [Clytia hemisphaerica]|uniref:FAD-dependent oxidoreductase domain-containing protein 2 n=1 Tax=Clytia hemisphaerica TaxID=252671 RepID=A0A7M5X0N5_9CNID
MDTLKTLLLLQTILLTYGKDYCIIGAGPSGLQMGYFLERAGRDYIIYERDPSPGWFYKVYPRHRTLISLNKRHTGKTNKEFNMRHDWNSLISDNDDLLITKYSKEFFPPADTLVKYLDDYARVLKLKAQYNTNILNVTYSNEDKAYTLTDKKNKAYNCKVLIVSTGMWVENYPKDVPGIDLTEGYPEMSINKDDYDGKSVLIIGRGNSGFETAQHLLGYTSITHMISRSRLKFSWETHYVGDVRAVNDGPIDTYQLKSLDGQTEVDLRDISLNRSVIDGKIYIRFGHGDAENATNVEDNLAVRLGYDKILRCTGFKFDRSIFDKSVRPARSDVAKKFPEITHSYESTKSKHMFFTGVSTHSLDFRKSAGGFIHGYRYTTRTLHRYLEWRYEGVQWPATVVPAKDLLNFIIKRLNEASGIYQMFSALVDVMIIREDGNIEYLEEVGIGMLPKFKEHTGRNYNRVIVLNLEYGKNFSGPGKDPFKEDRATGDAQEAHASNFLHPVLYYYKGEIPKFPEALKLPRPNRLHHMVEDFLTEWVTPYTHIMPLRWFLENVFEDDLRNFYAESCFEFAMTGMEAPLQCREEYLNGGSILSRQAQVVS